MKKQYSDSNDIEDFVNGSIDISKIVKVIIDEASQGNKLTYEEANIIFGINKEIYKDCTNLAINVLKLSINAPKEFMHEIISDESFTELSDKELNNLSAKTINQMYKMIKLIES